MHKSLGVIALLLALSSSGSVNAAPVLTLQQVGVSSVGVGGTVNFELLLINPDAVIGAFSVDIGFNPAALLFLPTAALGTSLGDINLFESIGTAGEVSAGLLHIDEVSLLDTASLESLQGGGVPLPSLLLATFSFEGLAPGLGALNLLAGSVQFSDASGTALGLPTLQQPGAVQVIPEPTSTALSLLALAVGGAGFCSSASARRRRV